jgi:hypothetical protein
MRQKGVVFATQLSTSQCAQVFKETGQAARGGARKLLEVTTRLGGHGDKTGFYTPTFDPVFAQVEGTPDFALAVNILKFGPAFTTGPGNGIHVHMYVTDEETTRKVEINAKHGMTDGGLAGNLVRRFLDAFQGADPGLTVTEGNI